MTSSDRCFDIVHVAYTSFPADTRVKREAMAAVSTGCRVAVVSLREPGQSVQEELGPLQIVRLPGTRSRKGPLSYLVEYTSFAWRCRALLAHDPRFHRVRVVHVHTLPDFLVWAAAPARHRGARIILDLHEAFPEFAASKYPGLMGRLAARIARGIEHAARRWADVTIAVNRPIDQLLATRPAGSSERRILVHNSADPEDFGAPSPPVVRSGSDTLELIYHGTLMPLYGLDSAIRGVALAAFQGARVRLTILGNGPERSALRQLAQTVTENGVVTFESAIPQTALRERLRRADAGVVPTRLDSMTRFSLSNKLLEYVHLGLPVLASRLPSYENYFPNEALWYWEPGNPTDLARAIHEFVSTSPQVRGARPLRAQQALASIGWPVERARLISVYNDLIAGYPVRSAQGT